MKKIFIIVWILLVVLTVVSALISLSSGEYFVELILGLAAIKFILVAFYFMDIKKAHIFWKSSIVIFISIIFTFIVFIIKY